jgi:hypothetical protein
MTETTARLLAPIRERGYRNGATGALCARLSDAAAVDIPRLLAAVEAVLEEADEWEASSPRRPRVPRSYAAQCFRAAIAGALGGTQPGEDENHG